jgi:hypothetical protein
MKLEGFRCDGCGTESRENAGRWHEVRSLGIGSGGFTAFTYSDGLHYCSVACLVTAIQEKWEK